VIRFGQGHSQQWAQEARPPTQSKCCFGFLDYVLAETCLKCTILVTNFQKSPSAEGSPPLAPLNLQYWWPEVPWFGQIVVFQADYDEIELQKNSLWRHHHYFAENVIQNNVTNFIQFAPLLIKISGYASGFGQIWVDLSKTKILHPKTFDRPHAYG